MNKRVLTLAATTLGAVAIVGAGFSAWYFTEELNGDGIIDSTEDTQKTVVVVTEAINLDGDFEIVNSEGNPVDANYKLVLNQVSFENKDTTFTEDTYQNEVADAAKGIWLEDSNGNAVTTITAKWTVDTDSYDEVKNNIDYNVTVTISDSLGKYVKLVGDVAAVTTSVASDDTAGTTSVTMTWTVSTFSYVTTETTDAEGNTVTTNMKPQTFAEYQEMVYDLGLATGASSASDVVENKEYVEENENTLITIAFNVVGK